MTSKTIFVVAPRAADDRWCIVDETLTIRTLSLEHLDDSDWRQKVRGKTAIATYLSGGITRHALASDHPELYGALVNAMTSSDGKFVTVGDPVHAA